MAQEYAETANQICSDFERMSNDRGNWENHWTEIAKRVIPSHSFLFQAHGNTTKGEKRTQELYDSTAAVALGRFSSILDSLLTPRDQTWHRLRPTNPDLQKIREVMVWFDEVNRLLFRYRYGAKANFSAHNQTTFMSLGAYGTGTLFVDELAGEPGLRYKNCHLSEIYLDENHQGIVDTVYRKFKMTARQIAQKWPDSMPDRIREAAKTRPEREFEIIHCVRPRQDRDPERADFRGMAFASYYVSIEGKVMLSEGGYTSMPYLATRYEQIPGEKYGRGPAMDVLPAIKTLNEQKKTVLTQGHRAVAPVLIAHDDGVLDTFSMKPGSINAGGVTADGRPLVHALPVGSIAIGKDLMDDERAVINDAFLVTLFQILTETPSMTATEVMERTREKGILLAPTLGRQQSEYLGPMIERELDLLGRLGLLPPPPPVLLEAAGEYRVEYDSPLSRVQRAEEASGLMRSLEATLNVVNVTQDPAPLDFYNWDAIIPELNEIHGVPAKWVKSLDEVQAIRQQRAEAANAQAASEAAPGVASLMNAAAKTKGARA